MHCENCGAVLQGQNVCEYCGTANKVELILGGNVEVRNEKNTQINKIDLSALTPQSISRIKELAQQIEQMAVQAKVTGQIHTVKLEEISDELVFLQEPIENENDLTIVFRNGIQNTSYTDSEPEGNLGLLEQLEILGQEGQRNGVVNLRLLDSIVNKLDDMEDTGFSQSHAAIRYNSGNKQVLPKGENSLFSKVKGVFKKGK